jgi:hypothetical protein
MKVDRSSRVRRFVVLASALIFSVCLTGTFRVSAAPFAFSTGNPDGLMATGSRPGPGSGTDQETESGDDFVLSNDTSITSATITGLLPAGADASNDIVQVIVEIYRVFPLDSDTNRTINVPTRTNSPSDVAFDSRDSASNLTFTVSLLNTNFAVSNSVDIGINALTNQTTGGEGAVTGQEVRINVTFTTPIDLPSNHYFFVPQVLLTNASDHFLWLSAPKPIVSPGTPFIGDLQEWIRNAELDPDWLRVATDIVGSTSTTFNAAFSLTGTTTNTSVISSNNIGIISIKPPKNINLKGAGPSLTKNVKVQIQNLGSSNLVISSASDLSGLVSVTLSNVQDSGCTPPTASLHQGGPNKPKTIKPNGKLNLIFDVTFDPAGCVPDPLKGAGHQDFSYAATTSNSGSNITVQSSVLTDVFLKQKR